MEFPKNIQLVNLTILSTLNSGINEYITVENENFFSASFKFKITWSH